MRTIVLVAFFGVAVFLACGYETPDPTQTVIDNYRAMDEENTSLYMSTVSGPRADIAGTLLESLFVNYDVSYTIDTVELLSKIKDQAQVRSVVTMRDQGGPKYFRHMRVVSLHKLHYENGKWTIYFTETEKPQILEETPVDTIVAKTRTEKDTI
ncbi:hypothetical protein DRQ36_03215 [bacterium]|nr:MAG: hypothetical protein DRQ36_03215 [bacterium]